MIPRSEVAFDLTLEIQEGLFSPDIYGASQPFGGVGCATFASDLERDCFRHFLVILPKLVLSSAHPGFVGNLVPEIVHKVLIFDGMKDAAVACGAANLHLSTSNPQMNDFALSYYYRAVGQVSKTLPFVHSSSSELYEAVQAAIIFLYIHGVSIEKSNAVASTNLT